MRYGLTIRDVQEAVEVAIGCRTVTRTVFGIASDGVKIVSYLDQSFFRRRIEVMTMFTVPVRYCSVQEWKLRLGINDPRFAEHADV